MNSNIAVRYQTRIYENKTDRLLKENPWRKNLVLDRCLDGLANRSGMAVSLAEAMTYCHVGGNQSANSIYDNSVTFTQEGTVVTASQDFFSDAMLGAILKYGPGLGGKEQYIWTRQSTTQVTMAGSGYSQAAPIAGCVWLVQQAGLIEPFYHNDSYFTQPNFNGTTYESPGILKLKRSYRFNAKPDPYNVWEIGWSNTTVSGNPKVSNTMGRAVLPSMDTVNPSNYYVVTIEITFKVLQTSPVIVPDVSGDGVINTAGTSMLYTMPITRINSSGGNQYYISNTPSALLQANGSMYLHYALKPFNQRANITDKTPSPDPVWTTGGDYLPHQDGINWGVGWVWVPGLVGVCRATVATYRSVNEQVCYGIGMKNYYGNSVEWDLKFDTPYTFPVLATWTPNLVMEAQYTRILTNPI